MKKIARAIIGANYGDEGKGLMTDYFVSRDRIPIVVRFNGGGQAGHTVQLPSGARHVFKHIGSGTFASAMTFLSKHFIVNPILFKAERLDLSEHHSDVFVDRHAMVSTFFDMLINQIIESHRNENRHGSCGVGIGETVERNENANGIPIRISDIIGHSGEFNATKFRSLMTQICDEWVPRRLMALGGEELVAAGQKHALLSSKTLSGVIDAQIIDFDYFFQNVTIVDQSFLGKFDSVLFEGAQGLALDQNNTVEFPFVTRSNTGLKNVLEICNDIGTTNLHPTYVTRAYLSRHGAGPFPNQSLNYKNFEHDLTNVENRFQGAIKYAHLNLEELANRIQKDCGGLHTGRPANHSLVMTCYDHLDDHFNYFDSDFGVVEHSKAPKDLNTLFNTFNLNLTHISSGPTRNFVWDINDKKFGGE